jgi:hypothetical protein
LIAHIRAVITNGPNASYIENLWQQGRCQKNSNITLGKAVKIINFVQVYPFNLRILNVLREKNELAQLFLHFQVSGGKALF